MSVLKRIGIVVGTVTLSVMLTNALNVSSYAVTDNADNKSKQQTETQIIPRENNLDSLAEEEKLKMYYDALAKEGKEVEAKPVVPSFTVAPALNCITIMGDSRTAAFIKTLYFDPKWKNIYSHNEFPNFEGVFRNDDTIIVVCGEAGGYFDNGAYSHTISRMMNLFAGSEGLTNSLNHYYFNLFGVNDLMFCNRNTAMDYLRADEQLYSSLTNPTAFYHLTVGPLGPVGEGGTCTITNDDVIAYNATLKGSRHIVIADLFGYLMQNGYTTINNASDATGLHYEDDTNKAIINYIVNMVKSNQSSTACLAPSNKDTLLEPVSGT